MVLQIFLGWVATLVVAGVSAGIMTAVLVYSPNKLMSDDRVYANKALNAESLAMVNLGGGPTGPLGVSLPPPFPLLLPTSLSVLCAPYCVFSMHACDHAAVCIVACTVLHNCV